jgi:carbon storage regulator
MLVLSRKATQQIAIGDDVWITVLKIVGNRVQVGIDAPNAKQILRGELVADRQVVSARRAARRAN